MTVAEFKLILAGMLGHWPHAAIPEVSERVWFNTLKDQDAKIVEEVVQLFAVEGREFPPTAGMILNRILQQTAAPEWDEVVAEVREMLRTYRRDRRAVYSPVAGDFYPSPQANEWTDELIVDLMDQSGGLDAWAKALSQGREQNTTFLAQQRNIWNGMRERTITRQRMTAIGASNLEALSGDDQAQLGQAVKQIGSGG